MGTGVDKLFLPIAGQPVIAHTWRRFESAPCVHEIVFVLRAGAQPAFQEIARQNAFRKPFHFVLGGRERQDSVWNGIEAIAPGCEVVVIHDGARPCVTEALIAATIAVARETGAAVAAQHVTDTIKDSADGTVVSGHLDRARLWAVQTPQTFRVEVIRRAISEARSRGLNLTDDTAACGLIGQPVLLVEGLDPNPKVTRPADLPFIELCLRPLGVA